MTWPHPSTHPTTHPPTQPPIATHPTTHPQMGNSSQISNLQTELKYLDKLKCYRILSDSGGPPRWGVADGWMGLGVGMGVWGVSHARTHAHTCAHTHTRTHAHTCMLNMLNMDASMLAAICNSIHVCVCMCVHVHSCGDTPMPPDTPRHPPPTCPLPRAAGSPKHQISITLELIEIIRFCLKILYLRTFLNSYRL